MGWTYISSLDEYDKLVTKDQSTYGRYTFKRYMYFKPDQYENWSKSASYTGIPYTGELVGNPNIPSAGVHLGGSLSSFYVNDVVSIVNMSKELHGDHCSYAKVTIEYENKMAYSGSSGTSVSFSSAQLPLPEDEPLKPWQKHVDDFQITNQEVQVPFTHGYLTNGATPVWQVLKTTAGQPLYGFTCSKWLQRLTWTYNSRGLNYTMTEPLINQNIITLFDKITIPAETGLLLPPSYRKLYFYLNLNDRHPTAYDQWTFEVIVDRSGFDMPILNCGTKAIFNAGQPAEDICMYYVYDPLGSPILQNYYGNFEDMMYDKGQVDQANLLITDPADQLVFNGDFTQSPIPLDVNGEVDDIALADASQTYILYYSQYKSGLWNIGTR